MDRSSSRLRQLALKAVGVFFGVAALHHLGAILWRSPNDADPALRHAIFVVVDAGVAVGLFLRPPFFFWFFTALSLQQLHSHGNALVHEWTAAHRVDWQSLLVLLVMPVTIWLLWLERKQRRNAA